MARAVPEIERLIEDGLTRYGQGDLDGALLVWEHALSIEPDNAQLNSYVDYVRENYEMLTADGSTETNAPFGIEDDEVEYQIEILPGEAAPVPAAPLHMDPLDEGWFIDDESSPFRQVTSESPNEDDPASGDFGGTVELEADEPPQGGGSINFDDETSEYPQGRLNANLLNADSFVTEFQHAQHTPGFGTAEDTQSPAGFGAQPTDIRKRELGFVRALRSPEPEPEPSAPPSAPAPARHRRASNGPPELKMTLRTPQAPEDAQRANTEFTPPPAGVDPIELDVDGPPPTFELSYAGPDVEGDLPPVLRTTLDPATVELVTSLPVPKTTRDLPIDLVTPAATTRDVAAKAGPNPPSISSAPTRDMAPSVPQSSTRDFSNKPTMEISGGMRAASEALQIEAPQIEELQVEAPLITALTRELGLRHSRPPTEEEQTVANMRPLRDRSTAPFGGTHSDLALPFDPIDARTAQILNEVDNDAPQGERRDDQTRRRITSLLERAVEWNREGDLDRAVAAVDLVLSEDPGSALAQKLVHRNRDTIMTVFQAFIGDLDRQPVLTLPLHELASAPINPRAAFLLSRVDGTLSIDEILDVSGMPRLEAYRHLCQLFLRGIMR